MRVLAVVPRDFGAALMGDGVEEAVLEEPESALVRLADSPTCLDHLIEHRLQSIRAGDRSEDVAERALLLAEVFYLACELGGIVERLRHSCG